ncbi:MAG: PhoH-like ATPase [Crocinitomicaceae bacterium]|jgi:PhoH-like ATPase
MPNRRRTKAYVIDTNVLIHDPSAIFKFEEHQVVIPMTVLEELDKLKTGQSGVSMECRQAIRNIDSILGQASPEQISEGVKIPAAVENSGSLSILMDKPVQQSTVLRNDLNDNKIINSIIFLQQHKLKTQFILVTKDINMRLKARGCGIDAEDYHNDQLVKDFESLTKGFHDFQNSFWDNIEKVETVQLTGRTLHKIPRVSLENDFFINQYVMDEQGFIGRIVKLDDDCITIWDKSNDKLLQQEAWGLTPRDKYQAAALDLLLDPDIHLVNLSGPAGSGKTILALAAAIEMTVAQNRFKRIIATRSVRGLDEDIGFLPGTEAEKMEPWLGAITDNLEALHMEDENAHSSIDYILQKVPMQFKSLNYIRGRSFQRSLIIIDESQNLTPHQMKTIITRAGSGSKVVCLGNLAQIDTPYLNATNSGLTYLNERFKGFEYGGSIELQGVPRSILAEYAETHL